MLFPHIYDLGLCFAGIDNAQIEHCALFSAKTAALINAFLLHLPAPVCLIAHNGEAFDLPILKHSYRAVGSALPPDIYFADSLVAFRALPEEFAVTPHTTPKAATHVGTPPTIPADRETSNTVRRQLFPETPSATDKNKDTLVAHPKKVSYALGTVYKRFFGVDLPGAHSAEGDCLALVQLFHLKHACLLPQIEGQCIKVNQ